MAHLVEKEKCNGCHACFNACPVQAIFMQSDDEGFLYPVIDSEKCIDCGKCDKACSIQAPPAINPYEDVYACYAKDAEEHRTSCSGGAFAVLARRGFQDGGVVAGAAFTSTQDVQHIVITSESEMWKLKGTKYVQSSIGSCYAQVNNYLKCGKKVIFSGTPCQVAGLKTFLGKEYENLITVDLICHGVPSPGIWQRYLNEIADGEKIVSAGFRNKAKGTSNVTLDYHTKSGRWIQEKYSESLYIKGFIHNLFVRPSCFQCAFKGTRRCSDFTIGDFWGAKEYHPKMAHEDGVSVLLVHSEKGQRLLEQCKESFILESSTPEKATLWNESIIQPAQSSPNREKFFQDVKTLSVKEAVLNNWGAPTKPHKQSKVKKTICKVKGRIRRWLA